MNGVWLRAGTPVLEPYPCMCWGRYPCGRHCPCRGRTDVDTMPQHCCGRRERETGERTETAVRGVAA